MYIEGGSKVSRNENGGSGLIGLVDAVLQILLIDSYTNECIWEKEWVSGWGCENGEGEAASVVLLGARDTLDTP